MLGAASAGAASAGAASAPPLAPPPSGVHASASVPPGKKSTVKESEWPVLVEKAVLHPFLSAPQGQRSNLQKTWLDAVNTTLRAGEDAIPITKKVARAALEKALYTYMEGGARRHQGSLRGGRSC